MYFTVEKLVETPVVGYECFLARCGPFNCGVQASAFSSSYSRLVLVDWVSREGWTNKPSLCIIQDVLSSWSLPRSHSQGRPCSMVLPSHITRRFAGFAGPQQHHGWFRYLSSSSRAYCDMVHLWAHCLWCLSYGSRSRLLDFWYPS